MTDQTTMTMTLPDGTTTGPFTAADLKAATKALRNGTFMKTDPDFRRHNQHAFDVTAEELRQFIERFERLAEERSDISAQQKEVMAEAKGRGYDTRAIRKIIALRRRKPDEVAEEEAVLDLYKTALGMT